MSFTLHYFNTPIWINLLDASIFKFSDFCPVWIQNISLSAWKLNDPHTRLLYLLDSSIWENAFLLPVGEYTLYCAIRKTYFLSPIRKMFFNLIIWEFKDLEAIRESSLCSFSFIEVVDNLLIRECLFDIVIVEVDYWITIRPYLSFNSIGKYNFFLAIIIEPLNFSIMTFNLIDKLWGVLAVIFWRKLEIEFILIRVFFLSLYRFLLWWLFNLILTLYSLMQVLMIFFSFFYLVKIVHLWFFNCFINLLLS